MRSGTELRKLYADSDEKQRQAIVADLFGRYTREAEQILNNKIAPAAPATGTHPVAEDSKFDPKRKPLMVKARLAHPFANSDQEALALYVNDVNTSQDDELNKLDHEEDRLERRVDSIERQLQDLLHKTVDETSYFVPAKQNIDHGYYKLLAHRYKKDPRLLNAKEKQELHNFINSLKSVKEEAAGVGVVKGGKDPRYMTATMGDQNDVTAETPNRNLRAFGLAEQSAVDRLTQHEIDHLNSLIDEISHRITTEKLPARYVDALKQRIEKLKAERAKLAFNV
jgi:predicted  nucleic acid-binding Zn-ribbon protein